MTTTTPTLTPTTAALAPSSVARPGLLRGAFVGNGLFSIGCGAVLAVGAGPVGEALGLASWLAVVLGVALVAYGIDLIAVAALSRQRPHWLSPVGRLVVGADVAWVVGAIVVIALGLLTTTGAVVLGVVTVEVAAFAAIQTFALGLLTRSDRA